MELFLDDEMDSEMLKAKQSEMNQQLEVLDQQIKEAKQANQSQGDIPNFDKLKARLILMITRFSLYLRKATPEAKNQLMKMLIDSIEITTDKQVKLVRYKIDESLIPQSLKKIGVFMPKFNFVINVANENRIENLSLLPLFRVTKVEEF